MKAIILLILRLISPKERIVFLHIPKAAGNTLRAVMVRKYKRYFKLYGNRQREHYSTLSERKKNSFNLIMGHIPYGFVEGRHVVMLRNPVDRIISEYYYTQLHDVPRYARVRKLTLKEFVESDYNTVNNFQTRVLAGLDHKQYEVNALDDMNFQEAKLNLEKCIVGTTEKFDESLAFIGKELGIKNLKYKKENVNESRPKEIPEDIKKIIEAKNKMDIELHGLISKQ